MSNKIQNVICVFGVILFLYTVGLAIYANFIIPENYSKVKKPVEVLEILPEDVIFESADIEKLISEKDDSYHQTVKNVTMTEFDCYMERAIEKGFKDVYYYNGGYCFWHGRNETINYDLHVVYDKSIQTLYITVFR